MLEIQLFPSVFTLIISSQKNSILSENRSKFPSLHYPIIKSFKIDDFLSYSKEAKINEYDVRYNRAINQRLIAYNFRMSLKQSSAKGSQQAVDRFAALITRKDEINVLKRKKAMLKEAILQQRKTRAATTHQLLSMQSKIQKLESENKKKQEKHEALLLEIRELKDSLIVERNEKLKTMQALEKREIDEKSVDESKITADSNQFFGLRKLFQR